MHFCSIFSTRMKILIFKINSHKLSRSRDYVEEEALRIIRQILVPDHQQQNGEKMP